MFITPRKGFFLHGRHTYKDLHAQISTCMNSQSSITTRENSAQNCVLRFTALRCSVQLLNINILNISSLMFKYSLNIVKFHQLLRFQCCDQPHISLCHEKVLQLRSIITVKLFMHICCSWTLRINNWLHSWCWWQGFVL